MTGPQPSVDRRPDFVSTTVKNLSVFPMQWLMFAAVGALSVNELGQQVGRFKLADGEVSHKSVVDEGAFQRRCS